MASPRPADVSPYERAGDVVRAYDRDRYIADLFAPQAARRHLFALHAFNAEIARIRDVVSEPAIGEIRIQWWRDAILNGAGGGHPVATALERTIAAFNLPKDAFERLLDARIFDLYDDVLPTLNDLEGYAGETSSAVIQLGALILADGDPGTSGAAGHAGVAVALTGLLRALPRNAARGQPYLPEAMVNSRAVDLATVRAGRTTPELLSLLTDLRTIARQHLLQAELELAHVDPVVAPAFLPLVLVRPYLDRMDAEGYDPFHPPEIAPWKRQWIVWRAVRTNALFGGRQR